MPTTAARKKYDRDQAKAVMALQKRHAKKATDHKAAERANKNTGIGKVLSVGVGRTLRIKRGGKKTQKKKSAKRKRKTMKGWLW